MIAETGHTTLAAFFADLMTFFSRLSLRGRKPSGASACLYMLLRNWARAD
jgi:hypothetical protein